MTTVSKIWERAIVETRQIAVAMIVLCLLFLEVVVAISCRNCSCNRPASTFIISCGCNFHFVGECKLIQTYTFPRIPPKIHGLSAALNGLINSQIS